MCRVAPFLLGYFEAHAFQSITTAQFLQYLQDNLLAAEPEKAAQVDVSLWVTQAGLPDDLPQPESQLMAQVDAYRLSWLAGKADDQAAEAFVTQQWLHFLDGLPKELGTQRMQDLDRDFAFSKSQNSEILMAWLLICIQQRYQPAFPRLEAFLLRVGRRKFVKPLYEELCKSEEGRKQADAIYQQARSRYHAVTQRSLDEIMAGR